MHTKRMTFDGASGESLAARLELPVGERPRAYALLAHCFTCSKNFKAVVNISRALGRAGIGVLRFDFTGLGESEGDFADTTFSSNVADLIAAARFLEQEYEAPALLIGHSLGGAAVLQAATHVPTAKAVVTIGAPSDPGHVKRHLTSSLEEIESSGSAKVVLAGRQFTIKKEFLDDLSGQNMEEVIGALNRALLIMHSPIDDVVGIENAARIYTAAAHPKSFVSLDSADHLLDQERDSLYAAEIIAAWVSRYIETSEKAERSEGSPDSRVEARTGESGYRTDIVANGHTMVADEPKAVGGTDLGPTPYDLVAAALGACTSMTLRMYADRKGWALEEAIVGVEHKRLHAIDERECEDRPVRLDVLERKLRLVGSLSEDQRERLREIADKCPVSRTLKAGVKVVSAVEDPNAGGD